MPSSIATQLGIKWEHLSVAHDSFRWLTPHFHDGFRIVLVGAVFDLTRRVCELIWTWVTKTFTTTATFESQDEAYKWITEWLERQASYSTASDFEVVAKPRTIVGADPSTLESQSSEKSPTPRPLATYFPAPDTFHWLRYGWYPLLVCRARSRPTLMEHRDFEKITLTLFSLTQSPLKRLIEQAGAEYRNRDLTGITIYIADQYGNWKRLTSRSHRNFASVVLEPKIKERLFGDVKEFLEGKQWYAQRGIPYRRGYLLFGTPGSGKTSSIHALASELRLDIYIVPLSLKAIDDGILSDLITSTPQRCILLYEDIDAAFRARNSSMASDAYGNLVEKSGVTLSGLLNTIDGVQAQEGCLLFATSNHPDHLDPALIRPVSNLIHAPYEINPAPCRVVWTSKLNTVMQLSGRRNSYFASSTLDNPEMKNYLSSQLVNSSRRQFRHLVFQSRSCRGI
ncbi:hypothetical protein FRC08_007916 [Ceratobasidium sp. 394]|nr:hypothetical protein FRC08_007916 [Ceratobasidium sp. 394]